MDPIIRKALEDQLSGYVDDINAIIDSQSRERAGFIAKIERLRQTIAAIDAALGDASMALETKS